MLRKFVFALLALCLPLLVASAASGQQYPPSGDGPAATTIVRSDPASDPATDPAAASAGEANAGEANAGGSNAGGSNAAAANAGAAPLARTGTDLALPITVGGVLLAGGAVALVISKRRSTSLA